MATEDTWHSMALAFSFRTLSRLQTYFSVSAPTGFLCILGYGPSFVVTGLLRLQASSPLCEYFGVGGQTASSSVQNCTFETLAFRLFAKFTKFHVTIFPRLHSLRAKEEHINLPRGSTVARIQLPDSKGILTHSCTMFCASSNTPPPPSCPAPPLVLPRWGLGGRHFVNTKDFITAHCVVVWVRGKEALPFVSLLLLALWHLPSLLPKGPNHHPTVLPKAFQWKVVSMCRSWRSSGAGTTNFTPRRSRSRSRSSTLAAL